MKLTCYKSLKVVAGRKEGDLHDVPVPPPLHPVLQEGERLLGVLRVGDGHQLVGLAQKLVLALLQRPQGRVLCLARVVLKKLGVDEGGDDGHEDWLSAALPKEVDQSGLVANDSPEEELYVGLFEGSVTDIDNILLYDLLHDLLV